MNSDFQTKMKFHIKNTLETLEIKGIRDPQVRISQTWNKIEFWKMNLDRIFKDARPKHQKIKNIFRK